MNPFDFYGPQFLLFYAALTIVVVAAAAAVRSMTEIEGGMRPGFSDPYLIAYLRGGAAEAIRIAVVSLVDRRLLAAGDQVRITEEGTKTAVRKPLEKALIDLCRTPQEPGALFSNSQLKKACEPYGAELTSNGLMPDEDVQRSRQLIFVAALAILLFFSIVKVMIGLSRNRPVMLLVFETILAIGILHKVAHPPRTRAGDAYLRETRNMFASLRLRAPQLHAGGATAEVALLAAVFGVGALAGADFVWTHRMFKKATSGSGSSCGASCGSSCGGGCGGGCGGCGG